jgi:hypothetical protein
VFTAAPFTVTVFAAVLGVGLELGVGLAVDVGLELGVDFGVLRGFGEGDGFGVVEVASPVGEPAGWSTTPAAAADVVPPDCSLARTLNPTTMRLTADIAAATRRLIGVPRRCRSPREPLLMQLLGR